MILLQVRLKTRNCDNQTILSLESNYFLKHLIIATISEKFRKTKM